MADAKRSEERRKPENLEGRALADRARYKRKKEEKEEVVLRHKIELGPPDSHNHKRLGYILKNKGRFEEAKDEYEKSIELHNNPDSHFLLGFLLQEKRCFSESKAEYRKAIELDPTKAKYPIFLAEVEEEERVGGVETEVQVCENT
jgi:tetratricopeptide (TPR) repeat protein